MRLEDLELKDSRVLSSFCDLHLAILGSFVWFFDSVFFLASISYESLGQNEEDDSEVVLKCDRLLMLDE